MPPSTSVGLCRLKAGAAKAKMSVCMDGRNPTHPKGAAGTQRFAPEALLSLSKFVLLLQLTFTPLELFPKSPSICLVKLRYVKR